MKTEITENEWILEKRIPKNIWNASVGKVTYLMVILKLVFYTPNSWAMWSQI